MIATVSGVVGKLPPMVRDFEIYRFVKFDCNSTREAAGEFELSQTRVRQVIRRVGEFFIESVPHAEGDDQREVRLVAAERLAREQLEYLYFRTMMAFDHTQREDEHGNVLPGKVGYLAMAGRLVLWMSKVPLHEPVEFREDDERNAAEEAEDAPMSPEAMEQFKDELRAECAKANAKIETMREQARLNVAAESEQVRRVVEAQRQARQARLAPRTQAGGIPPNADCSVVAVSRGEMASLAVAGDVISVPEDGTYKSLDEIKAEARRSFLRPAQSLEADPRETPRRDDLGEPGEVDAAVSRPLSRKERRARARQLKRALAKR